MNERTVPDEFDAMLRDAFTDVSDATRPDPGLADLLIANAREGRPAITSLATRRDAKRWVLPLLAVASIAAVVVGIVAASKMAANDHHAPPGHSSPNPNPPKPKPGALPHFRAADVSFSDAQHGWALGDAACSSGKRTNCPALLATTDGGSSWHAMAVPKHLVSTFNSSSCGTNGTLTGRCVNSVLFATASDGYLWSLHEIYSTTDGGRSWARYVDPAHDWDGASQLVIDGDSVLRIAPLQQCSSGCPGAVETAPVGTTQWQVVHPTTQEVGLYSSKLAVAGSDVYLFAGLTYDNTSAGIFRSSDGGRSWTHLTSNVCGPAKDPEQDPFSGQGSTVADNGALIANCLGSPTGIRMAAPGSSTFSGVRAFPPGRTIELEAASSQNRIVVANTSHAYSGGSIEIGIYVTSDGGRTWRRTATIPVRGGTLRFTSGTHGYGIAADGSQLTATDDGGVTWRRIQFSS
jgi:photosystem II stability/assembly factor-like uncharacterized protein